MSLLVWLPLDGDLRNLGCSDIQPSLMGTGITYSAGKIGNAATFPNNSNSCIYMPGLKQQIFSWCCWFKCDGEGSSTSQRILSEGRDTGSVGTNIYLSKAGTTLTYSTHKKVWSTTIALNTWYHICLTCDENNIRFYINGELKNTTTYTEDSDYAQSNDCFVIGKMAYTYTSPSSYFPFNGQINDVRIYDHCLSLAEIKEISQGLVVHYNLEGANQNYLQNSNFTNGVTSWLTVNSSTITITQINGITVATGTKGTSNYIIGQISTLDYTANTSVNISISADVYVEESGTFTTGNWITTTAVAGWQTMLGSRLNHLPLDLSPGWNKISTTLRNMTQQYSGKVITAFGYTGTTFYITNVKLEVSAKPTNWVPHVNDKLFFTLGYDSSVVEDMSGYGHNGSMIGRIEAMADSPRYKTSLNFPANDSGIEIPSMPMNIFNNGNTVAFWIKPSGEDGQRSVYCSSYNGTSYSIEKTTGNKLRIWWAGSPDVYASKLTINDNEWQHIAIVKTEDKQSLLLYKNGEYIETLTNTFPDKEWSGTYRLGRDTRTDNTAYIGQMSDFRIYCTPLLDTDIKLLYNTSVKVNKLGGIHSFSTEEGQTNKITKTGCLHAGQVCENARCQYLKYDNNLYFEPDSSVWVRVFHHSNPASKLFNNNIDEFINSVYIDEDRWFNMQVANQVEIWEIMVKCKATSEDEEIVYRWIQNANPMTCAYTDVTNDKVVWNLSNGYATNKQTWGGLFKKNSATYLAVDNNTNGGNWWGAIGAWGRHQGGIPGYAPSVITTGYEDVYLRIDNQSFTNFFTAMNSKYNIWFASNIIES